eukprot:2107688-Prymnesium_polylepis.1
MRQALGGRFPRDICGALCCPLSLMCMINRLPQGLPGHSVDCRLLEEMGPLWDGATKQTAHRRPYARRVQGRE